MVGLLALAAVLAVPAGAAAGGQAGAAGGQAGPPAEAKADTSAAMTLAERYTPVVMLQPQHKLCGPGEAFRPTTVDIVFGQPEVTLRNSRGTILKRAPTAQDLSAGAPGDHVDFGGNALRPECFYEKQFVRWFGDREPSVYAHIATDPEHPGKLAVQYWFFYTFNDFTNKHEADWEMTQVDFDAATPEAALKKGPYQVDLAQHAGGERGAWDDPKLTKEGTHPVNYIVTGAHAAYFQQKLYLGTGGSTVFGCEDTRHSTERVPVHTVLLPDTPVPVDSRFAWLNFPGRWGQKQRGINNGIHGPAESEQWTHPITWANGLRTRSLVVPGAHVLGLSVTSFFCGAVDRASIAMNWGLLHPVWFFLLCILIVLVIAGSARRTQWRPREPWPVRRSRRGGQILRAAASIYRRSPLTFIGIGAVFIPVSFAAAGVQWVLFHLTGLGGFVSLDGDGGAGTAIFALLIGDIGAAFAAAAVTAAVSAALNELDTVGPVDTLRAYKLAGRNDSALIRATWLQFMVIAILVLTVIGIPFAIWYFVRTSFFVQACVLENESTIGSLRASRRLTRRSWWRTFGMTLLVNSIAILSGPLLGVLLLLITSQSLTFIDITGAIVYALVVPYAAIALTLYYFDLQERRKQAAPPEAVPAG
ncbi:MAG: hypothetical protein FWD04_03265 [Conexibacteraceae bacterium]|nr:hypothetical protein [Conexibacteraceae bacterium]